MTLRRVSKAIAGAASNAVTGASVYGVADFTLPEGVEMPWWGYLLSSALATVWGWIAVYFAPKNSVPRPRRKKRKVVAPAPPAGGSA